ncbi:glycosyl transferase [Haloarcula hispanica]|uniref:Glycosyl transferase n=1 Tax=Haloarcula hispanica TaxID=51589 RepID=A0A482T1I6_HALHI|nr:glycosyl transferase [Haloarcula hispanica]MCJ0618896.1 glycosyl transferase [Haloarcula hispanica]RYJ09441.1 glycosyl transferase [Haloarcula hispanica]
MIGGPRLDTPSAVGDEGRPRATSLTIVALIVAAFALATGVLSGDPRLFSGIALLAGIAVAGLTLLDRDGLGPTVIGHLCFLPAATGVVASVGQVSVAPLLALGVAVAMVGVATAWTDVLDRETVSEATVSSVVSYLFAVVGLVVGTVVVALAWLCWKVVSAVAGGASPIATTVCLGVLGVAASGCLYFAVTQLPLLQLTARSRRDAMVARLKQGTQSLKLVALGSAAFSVVVPLALLVTPFGQLVASPPFSLGIRLLSSWVVLAPLLAVTAGALLAGSGAIVIRKFTTEFDAASVRTVGAAIAAAGYVVLLAPFLLRIGIFGFASLPAVFFGALLLPLVVYLLLVLVIGGLTFGLLPARAGPAALTASGLICASIGVAQADLSSLLVFAGVVGGLVVWDVGTFGLGLTAELGHRPETRRLELYHSVFAVGVGLLGIAAVGLVDTARHAVGAAIGSPETMALAAIGVLLLLAPLRG